MLIRILGTGMDSFRTFTSLCRSLRQLRYPPNKRILFVAQRKANDVGSIIACPRYNVDSVSSRTSMGGGEAGESMCRWS